MKNILIVVLLLLSVLAHSQSLPSEVKAAVIVALKASDTDGVHEEGFKWGKDVQGHVLISMNKPGKPCMPGGTCSEIFEPADPSIDEKLVTVDGFAHVHPCGNSTQQPVQVPSKTDFAFAAIGSPDTINMVIASKDQRIYYFNATGVTGSVKLKEFLAEVRSNGTAK